MGGTRAPPRGWDQEFSAAIRLMRQLAGMPGSQDSVRSWLDHEQSTRRSRLTRAAVSRQGHGFPALVDTGRFIGPDSARRVAFRVPKTGP